MNLKDLDLTSCRLAGSNDLCDEITLPLERALAVTQLMSHDPDVNDSLTAIIEYEIKHAQQVADKCQCKLKEGAA